MTLSRGCDSGLTWPAFTRRQHFDNHRTTNAAKNPCGHALTQGGFPMSDASVRLDDPAPGRHPVDQMLPFGRLVVLGLQHVLVMYAGCVAVPLIVGGALGLSSRTV